MKTKDLSKQIKSIEIGGEIILNNGSVPSTSALLKEQVKPPFCEKCITCKFMHKINGDCMNANKWDWLNTDCQDFEN